MNDPTHMNGQVLRSLSPELMYDEVLRQFEQERDAINELSGAVRYLQDLFIRRLNEDKQKTQSIQLLQNAASYSFIEPFLQDLILLLDRLDSSGNETAKSAADELYEILRRRGVARIPIRQQFDPAIYKAIRVTEDPEVRELTVTGVIRNGYMYSGKILRPAEVTVSKPVKS